MHVPFCRMRPFRKCGANNRIDEKQKHTNGKTCRKSVGDQCNLNAELGCVIGINSFPFPYHQDSSSHPDSASWFPGIPSQMCMLVGSS